MINRGIAGLVAGAAAAMSIGMMGMDYARQPTPEPRRSRPSPKRKPKPYDYVPRAGKQYRIKGCRP